jgi:hypothetical protein
MSVGLKCPHCGEFIECEFWEDVQGEGCMTGRVSGVEILNQPCSCELSNDDLDDLAERAEVAQAESIARHYERDFELYEKNGENLRRRNSPATARHRGTLP